MGLCRFNALSEFGVHTPVIRPAGPRPQSSPTQEDRGVVERARAGDVEARDELVRRYLPDVYRATVRVLGDPDLAQDATQDTFINALGGLSRFRGDASFRTWLLRIAINAARTVGRRSGRRREVTLTLAEHEASRGADPARLAEASSDADRLEHALQGLPPKQRVVVALRVQQGLSYSEIAAALKCSEGAARVNYHLGVKRLREQLR
jgi:RNA polymerase sigma-70 factor (ECF subfamily)